MARVKLLLILFLPWPAIAQSDMGSWNILSAKASITEKWGVFVEGQIRSLKFYNNFHYHEIKGGVSYALDKNFSVAVAGGSVWIENGNDNRSPLRGGSWGYNPNYCRSAIRYDYYFRRVNRINNYGFRVVCGAGRTL